MSNNKTENERSMSVSSGLLETLLEFLETPVADKILKAYRRELDSKELSKLTIEECRMVLRLQSLRKKLSLSIKFDL